MFSINLRNKIRIINRGSFWSLVTLHRTIPTWFEPYGFTQSKALKEISLILGVVSSCIFSPFSSCNCKDHLGFALYQGEYEFQHFIGFKNYHHTGELCEVWRLSWGGMIPPRVTGPPSQCWGLSQLFLSFSCPPSCLSGLTTTSWGLTLKQFHLLSHVSEAAQTRSVHKKCSGE